MSGINIKLGALNGTQLGIPRAFPESSSRNRLAEVSRANPSHDNPIPREDVDRLPRLFVYTSTLKESPVEKSRAFLSRFFRPRRCALGTDPSKGTRSGISWRRDIARDAGMQASSWLRGVSFPPPPRTASRAAHPHLSIGQIDF
jgi:hypothetical protein